MPPDEEVELAGPYGQLTPCGGGDPIPLMKKRLLIGRRGAADIQLKFNNVSTAHCRMTLEYGYWFVRDLNSRNGTKVDSQTVERKRVDPGSTLSIARHDYIIEYEPRTLGASGPPPADDDYMEGLLRSSLMDRAGLSRKSDREAAERREAERKAADKANKRESIDE